MNITVTKNQVSVNTDYILNDKEYNVNQCYFTFSDEYTDDLVKKAIFVQGTSRIEMPIINNQCQIPAEVLNNGQFELRVYAYEVDGDELLLRYSPSYTTAYVRTGSYIENAESPEVITPTQFEQYMQAMNDGLNEVANVNIDAEQLDNGMSVTITNRYGEDKTVYAYDGEKGKTGATPNLTIGTVETGTTSSATITGTPENPILNLVLEKGETGETGATGNGIASFEKTSTSGLVDTYTITFTNGTTSILTVTNGKGITSIIKTSTSNLTDTYTITYNDNTTSTFYVTNGRGIVSIDLTSTEENIDTYTITYNDGTTSTYTVTNSTVTDQEFETLEAEVNKYKTLSLLLPKVEGEGSSIELNNTVEGVTMDITPEGNTTQNTTTGKNLFDKDNVQWYRNNNSAFINTSNSSTTRIRTTSFEITGGKTYTVSGIPDEVTFSMIRTYEEYGGENTTDFTKTGNIITLGANIKYIYLLFNGSNFTDETNTLMANANIQIEEGDIATSYEPYTGGQPSPSPDYPQAIKVVTGEQSINIHNKNLLDTQYFENGSIDANTGQNIDNIYNGRGSNYIPVLPNTTYTISVNTTISALRLSEYTNEKVHIQRTQASQSTVLTITTTANTYFVRWSLNYNNSVRATQELIDSLNLQLEQSPTATSYQKYSNVTYPISLGTLELAKIGDYQDYIYGTPNNWYKYKCIQKVVFDGVTNAFFGSGGTASDYWEYQRTVLVGGNGLSAGLISTHFNQTTSSRIVVTVVGGAYLRFPKSLGIDVSTSALLNAWLQENNVTAYYLTAEPKLEPITDTTLIAQLNNLYSAIANQEKTFIECTSTDLNNAPLIVKASTYKDISSILNPTIESGE